MDDKNKLPTITVGPSLEEVAVICNELNSNWINGMKIHNNFGTLILAEPTFMHDDFDTRCMIRVRESSLVSHTKFEPTTIVDNIPPLLVKGDNGILVRIMVNAAIQQRLVGITLGKEKASKAVSKLINETIRLA